MGIPATPEMIADWERRGLIKPTAPTQTPPPDPSSEKEFQADVIRFAKSEGWLCYHTRDSRRSESGFPDLVLIRDGLIVAELKTADGRLTASQANWLDSFRACGIAAYLWRPADWPRIVEVLVRESK